MIKKYGRSHLYSFFFILLAAIPILSSCANQPHQSKQASQSTRQASHQCDTSRGGSTTNSFSMPTGDTITSNMLSRTGQQSATTSSSRHQGYQTVTVSYDSQATSVSQFAAGLTQSDNRIVDGGSSDQCVLSSVQSMIKQGVNYVNTPIMAWGLPDPWPDPSTPGPTDWDSLDARVQLAQRLGNTPVITLAEAPWWMKGTYVGHGKTQPLTADQEWQSVAYDSRILDNKMDAWTHLVQAVAQRYMRPPYNVRYFQVWNELKGYYDPDINNYDFTTSAGDPAGSNARHGYTYMYNQVYATLMNVASSLHVPQQDVKAGGPYVVMDIWSNAQQSNPSGLVKPYGVFDQRSLDVVQYWLQHKSGAGFITFDASLENRDTMKILHQQPFVAASIFADTVRWIRSLNPTLYPGANTLPIWLAEWYACTETDNTSLQEDNALKTVAMLQFIEAGGGIALSWNNFGNGGSDYGLWSPTQKAGGDKANPWYNSYKALTEHFGSGTTLYHTTVSDPGSVAALAAQKQLLLVNQTAHTVQVHVNGSTIALNPYQVSFTALK